MREEVDRSRFADFGPYLMFTFSNLSTGSRREAAQGLVMDVHNEVLALSRNGTTYGHAHFHYCMYARIHMCIELLLLLCVIRIMTADEFISTTEQVFRKYFYGFSAANILAECLVF